jgi:type II secretory pathway pseudopilin PulG
MEMAQLSTKKNRKGFALLESLIAVVVGGILIGTAALVIAVMLRVSKEDRHIQAAWFQNQSAMEAASSIIETNWSIGYAAVTAYLTLNPQLSPLTNPSFFSANINEYQQFLTGSGGAQFAYVPCAFVNINELNQLYFIEVDGEKYYTCFDVMSVIRNSDGTLTNFVNHAFGSAGLGQPYADTSTLRLSVKTLWNPDLQANEFKSETSIMHRYLTRHRNRVFRQTDWSGGASILLSGSPDPALPEPLNFFYSQDDINFAVPGKITKVP